MHTCILLVDILRICLISVTVLVFYAISDFGSCEIRKM